MIDGDRRMPSARGAAVSARGWGWRHGGRHAWAGDGIDLEIAPGERVLVLGASGSGKSTLAHALAGVLGGEDEGEERGELRVDGRDPRGARGRVGLVLQDPDSQVVLARVGDDVAFGCENLGVPREEIWRRVDAALEAVGLDLPREHATSNLSGGQKQRLALASVIAMQPGLIVLDEPTANLDPLGVIEVRDAVARLTETRQATLVVIEHRVEAWLPVVDRVIVLDAGRVVADGAPEAVLASDGARLAASGVWVPGFAPAIDRRTPPTEAPALLSAEGLSVARTKGELVAGGLRLEARAGRALAISGANGSGKSTLALTLAGLLPPALGTLAAAPMLAAGAGPAPIRWKSRELLTRIGMVFQEPEYQFVAGSVRAELAVGPRALRMPDAAASAHIDELLVRLRLEHLADANPFTLSGGEKRRLSVATVLATRPAMLVLDEPTFGQDARTWAELVGMLSHIVAAGTAIVAVSHDAAFVDAIADDVFRMPSAARAREAAL